MRNERVWMIGAGLAVAVVLTGGWFVGVQPQLALAGTTTDSAVGAEGQNQALQMKLANLSKLAATEPAMRSKDAKLQKAVPSIVKPNITFRHINELAALHAVDVVSVDPGAATPYTVPESAAAKTAAASVPAPAASGGATPVPTETAAPVVAPVATTATAPALARTDPLITPANFVTVPISVTVSGTQSAILDFSTALQHDERVFSINNVVVSAGEGGTQSGVLSGFVYALAR